MNGYFQVVINESGVGLNLYAPKDGGDGISIKELTGYLNRNSIDFDLATLNKEITNLEADKFVQLMPVKILPIAESSSIIVSDDKLEATARFYPASTGGRVYTKEDVLSDLRINKIAYGVDEAAIDAYIKSKNYCTNIVLAKGKPCRHGSDAVITYNFPTDNKIRPKLNDDGTVDFKNLNILNSCKAGDVLAVLTKEDKGEPGIDVLGNAIKQRDVKRLTLSYGLNIDINEDKTELVSKVNGNVSLVNGKVFVSDVYEVANVDNSTGNIDYEGNVRVNGNVCSGFSVKAKGCIEIRGVVEGAYLEAGENIVITRGINGMGKGELHAGGNIISKFFENCKAYAGGYVETENILHSVEHASESVNVTSRKGFITGGSVSAGKLITVKSLGSPMGAATEVTVGIDPSVTNRYAELAKTVNEIQKQLKVSVPVLDATMKKISSGVKLSPEQVKTAQQLALTVKEMQANMSNSINEMAAIKEQIEDSSTAKIEVSGEVYSGTKITISDVSTIVKDSFSYCKFVKEQGTVKMKPL